MKGIRITLLLLIGGFAIACTDTPIPKPYGYFRIDFPEKDYRLLESDDLPYQFEYPVYSLLTPYPNQEKGKYWYNLNFPLQKAQLHLSYHPIQGNLRFLLDESHQLAFKHQIISDAIQDEVIMKPDESKFGLIYHIRGNAASPIQFFLTDSTHHFLRGSLYFLHAPNADSIAPVLQFIESDIDYLINSLVWKDAHD